MLINAFAANFGYWRGWCPLGRVVYPGLSMLHAGTPIRRPKWLCPRPGLAGARDRPPGGCSKRSHAYPPVSRCQSLYLGPGRPRAFGVQNVHTLLRFAFGGPRRRQLASTGVVIAGFKGFGWRLERHSKSPPARVRWCTAVHHARFCGARRAPHFRVHGGAERFRQRSGDPRWHPASAAAMCTRWPSVDALYGISCARKLTHSCAHTATR